VILLDTNVISELMRPQPEPRVLAWADGLDPEAVAITAMNEAEILHGLARLPDGLRKQDLQQSWDTLDGRRVCRPGLAVHQRRGPLVCPAAETPRAIGAVHGYRRRGQGLNAS
jgi:predicted nucleic acid-binding protein